MRSRARLVLSGRWFDAPGDVHSPVVRSAAFRRVILDRRELTLPLYVGGEFRADLFQGLAHGPRPLLGEPHVVGLAASVVGMSGDGHGGWRMLGELIAELLQRGKCLLIQFR